MIASLPMYVITPVAVQTLWHWIRQDLIKQLGSGYLALLPESLSSPQDLHLHWQQQDVLFSQTCGYPLVTELKNKVHLLGSFEYDVPFANGIYCKSVIICKANHEGTQLSDFKNKVVAFNSAQSQSGYNSFRHLIAPLSNNGQFFQSAVATGAHKASVLAVQSGQADIASIDGVTYHGFLQHAPEITQGLKIIATTHSYPGLPLISALNTPTAVLTALKNTLQGLHLQPALQDTLKTLFIKKFSVSSWQDYEVCLDMEKQAQALNYLHL